MFASYIPLFLMMALAAVGCGSGNAPENTHQNARCAGSASVDALQAEGLPTTAEMVRMSVFCCIVIFATEASMRAVRRSS